MTAEAQDIRVESHEESPILKVVEVEVGPKRVKKAFDRAYKDLSRQVRVKGFRPGKAPRSVLERMYGPALAEQIEQTLVQETLGDAVELAGVEPVAEPAIEADAPKADETFKYKARIEVKPPVELPDLAGLPAKKPVVDVPEEDVQKELDQLQERQAQLIEEPEGTPLAEGHTATIDFVGRIDGEAFEGGTGQGVDLELGSGQFIPGFEEQLAGVSAGDDLEVRVSFPDDYHATELAGKEAVFATHVVAVKKRQVPELDDEFAKDLGECDTLADLRTRIHDSILHRKKHEAEGKTQQAIIDKVLLENPIPLPDILVEGEIQNRMEETVRMMFSQGMDPRTMEIDWKKIRDGHEDGARKSVHARLVLDAIAKKENLEVEEPEVNARIKIEAQRIGESPEKFKRALLQEGRMEVVKNQILREKSLDFLVSVANIQGEE